MDAAEEMWTDADRVDDKQENVGKPTRSTDEDRAPTVREEAGTLIGLGLPVSFARLLSRSVPIVSLFFVGRMTDPARLAAASLASSVANVSGYSVMIGLAGALNTLAGQSYGAGHYAAVGHNVQMALLLSIVAAIVPVSFWVFSEPILVFLGQERALASLAGKYLWLLIPSLYSYGFQQCLMVWYQVLHVVRPLTVASLVVSVLNVPLNWLLVSHVGYLGGALSVSAILTLNVALNVGYMYVAGLHKKTWKGFSFEEAMLSCKPMLKLSLGSLAMLAEWWNSEVNVLFSGMLASEGSTEGVQQQGAGSVDRNELTLSAMSIFQNMNGLFFMVPLGLSMAISARVSQELGAGRAGRARRSANVGILVTFLETIVVGICLVVFRQYVGSAFTRDQELVDLVASLMVYLCMYHMCDGICGSLNGILWGSGQQTTGAICVLVSYFVVGLPVSYVLAFKMRMGLLGLIFGRLSGKFTQTTLYIIMYSRMNWDEQVERSRGLLRSISLTKLKGADRSRGQLREMDRKPRAKTITSDLEISSDMSDSDSEDEREQLLS